MKIPGGGRSKIKVPSVGGMHSVWNYTTKGTGSILLQNFGIKYLSMWTIDMYSLHNWWIMVWTFYLNNLISNIATPQYQTVLLITSKGIVYCAII